MWHALILLLVMLAAAATDYADCPSLFFRDVELARPGELVDEITVATRSGVVVVDVANETAPFIVTILVRFSGPCEESLTAGVVERVSATGSSINVIACQADGSGDDCSSSRMRASSAVFGPAMPVFLASWPMLLLAEAASDDCVNTAITITVPLGWRGALSVTTEDGSIAFLQPLNFSALSVETWTGAIASTWEAQLSVDGPLALDLHESAASLFLARVVLTGDGPGRCALQSNGAGEATFSFVDMPAKQTPCDVVVSVDNGGYFGVPNLRFADGAFMATVEDGGEVSFGGSAVYSKNTATLKAGTMGTGAGLHRIDATLHSGGSAVVFCKK